MAPTIKTFSVPFVAAGLALVLPGCVSLRPYDELRSSLPKQSFLEIEGHQVYVEDRGHGEAVVLVHGFGASSYAWRKVAPLLESSWRIVAPDLYGFGYTERPSSQCFYTREAQAHLVLGVLDRLGIERAHLVGHSYGGAVALTLAQEHPERLRSLILVDTAHPRYSDERRRGLAQSRLLVRLYVRLLALRRSAIEQRLKRSFFDQGQVTPEMVTAYRQRLAVEGAVDAFRGLTAPLAHPEPPVDLQAISVPTLAIWGARDPFIPVDSARRAIQEIPGARFVTVEEAGHGPMEEQPDAVAREIARFVSETADPDPRRSPPAQGLQRPRREPPKEIDP